MKIRWKNLLWLLLALVVFLVIGYFVWSYLRLHDRGVPKDALLGTYISLDGTSRLRIAEDRVVFVRNGERTEWEISDLRENLLELGGGEELCYILVFDRDMLYFRDQNIYLYREY